MRLQLGGEIERAEQLYREILRDHPDHAAAHYCLGMLNVQRGRAPQALPQLLAAIEAQPQVPDYWLGYLEALLVLGRRAEAEATLELGVQRGLAGREVDAYRARLAAGAAPLPAAAPDATLMELLREGRFGEARTEAVRLTERLPDNGVGWKALGAFLCAEGRIAESLPALRNSVRLLPQDPEAHSNLGVALVKLERYDEAEQLLRHAITLDPALAASHYRLGMKQALNGEFAQAVESVRHAMAQGGDGSTEDEKLGYSNLLFSLCHLPGVGADELFAEHCRAGERFERDVRSHRPQHANNRDASRRLRIGWVSGDFRDHAVAYFLEPVLRELHGSRQIESFAYYNHSIEDATTRRFRGLIPHWRQAQGLSDLQLAQSIRDDSIDILVDLSGHTGYSRLGAFAHKPAPVQVSWLGYAGTTGLSAIDYYMTDRHYLPPAEFARQFTEKLVFLPAMAPFTPAASAPPVNELPAIAAGYLTFGSFNRIGKLNRETVESWSRLLRALPGAKMLLVAVPPGPRRDWLIGEFAHGGVARERLVICDRCSMEQYLALHHSVDLCLDTRPWTGGTTTNHALWMGVPTLTLAGSTPASRISAALLGQVGLEAFIAANDADLVDKGLYWAANVGELAKIRAGLRQRCEQSPMRRADLVSAAIESAFRTMWQRWCRGLPPDSFDADASIRR
jgi:predicted O-linked N-acetylglucosamine transferase (SPINDLY family)